MTTTETKETLVTTTKKTAGGETFVAWARRVTEAGEYDLSALLAFISECQAHWADRGEGKEWTGPWWQKVEGREYRKGRLPRTMKHPKTGVEFVFPIFDVKRGERVEATLLSPRCYKCGSDMVLRARKDPALPKFFGCSSYPKCRFATDAWLDVTGKAGVVVPPAPAVEEPKPEPKPVVVVKPRPEVEALVARVCAIVERARRAVEEHGMTLPIGYRTVAHLSQLAVLRGNADDAWRLWIDGRVSDQERAKLDAAGCPAGAFYHGPSSDEEPAWYHTLAAVLDTGLPVFLVGEAGSGKTRFAKWYAARIDKTLHTAIGSDDVAGRELWVARRDASAGTTTNVLGPAAKASAHGEVLFLDEVDGFSANSLLPLNGVLNGDRELTVPVLGELKVHAEVRIIAAANTNGRSKDRTYTARNRLDGAFLNRFAVVVRTAYEARVDRKVAQETVLAALAAKGL